MLIHDMSFFIPILPCQVDAEVAENHEKGGSLGHPEALQEAAAAESHCQGVSEPVLSIPCISCGSHSTSCSTDCGSLMGLYKKSETYLH